MSSLSSVAATLRPETRQQIAIEALAKSKPISHLATEYEVSRKFVYEQSGKAQLALNESFEPTTPDEQILFHLPITKAWLFQLILGLVLICHSSLRGVVELLRDVFDVAISASTVRNRLNTAAAQASAINAAQDLSSIEVDLRDEIFQARSPVLVGVDAASTYCYLLALAEHRDADTWGCHLLDSIDRGLAPNANHCRCWQRTAGGPSGGAWRRSPLSWRCFPYSASMPERCQQPDTSGHGSHHPSPGTGAEDGHCQTEGTRQSPL